MSKSQLSSRVTPGWELLAEYVAAGQIIVGIDEVGRGAWAGPVVAGAVIMSPAASIPGLNDSKMLTPPQRRRLDWEVRRHALAIGLGWVSATEVDQEGLSWAVRESGRRALAALEQPFDLVILDGKHNYLDGYHPAVTFVKADQLIVPVAAASVVAKVARDRYLERLAFRHPGYGLERHKGYGTSGHARALIKLGPTIIHRRSWNPLRQLNHVNN